MTDITKPRKIVKDGPHHWFTKLRDESDKFQQVAPQSAERMREFAAAWYHDHCEDLENWNCDKAKLMDAEAALEAERSISWWERCWLWLCSRF